MKKSVLNASLLQAGNRSFIVTTFIFVFLVCCLQSFAQSQAVMTDTSDYTPGDTAFITGSGWVAGDTITVQVLHTDSVYPDSDYAEHQPWQITADSAGNIQTYWIVPHDAFGSSLVVTATDYALGYSAEYYFYDGLANDAFQSRQSGTWNVQTTWMKGLTGTSVTFTSGSKTVTGSGTQFTSQLSVGDSLMLQSSSNIIRGVVDSLKSATLLVLKSNATATVSGAYGKQAVPNTSDGKVEIMAGHIIEVSANVTVHEVTVDSGGVVNVDTLVTLSVAHIANATPTFTVNGTLNLTGAMNSDSGSVFSIYGTVNLTDTITLSQHNNFTIFAGGVMNILSTGYFNMNPTGAASLFYVYGTVNSSGYILTGVNSGTVVVATIENAGGTVNLTGNATWNLTGSGNPELDLAGGTLSMAPNTLVTGSNGSFTEGLGSTLKIGSTGGIAVSGDTGNIQTGYRTFNGNANYNYNGTSPQVTGSGLPNNLTDNLIITNTSGVTPSKNLTFNVGGSGATLTVNGLFTPTASQTITAASGAGILNGSGTILVTASGGLSTQCTFPTKTLTNLTVGYAGTSSQTLSGLTYGNLQINNSSNVALGGNTTLSGALTLASGKITTGSYTLSLDSTATISGDSAGRYVYGNLLWDVPSGSPSVKFAVGDSTNYTPVTVDFTGVTTPGTLTVKTTKANDPHISTSGIDSTKEVKRYWTMTNVSTVFSSYNATLNFVSGDVLGGANPSYFILKQYSSSAWGLLTTGTLTSLSSRGTGIVNFGDISIGYPLCTASSNPTSASASLDTICSGSSATLTLSGGGGGTYQTIHWYSGSCGGTSAGTGNSLSVSPTTTTTYYGRYEDSTACSYNSSCQSVAITVIPQVTWYRDYDGDGYGASTSSVMACSAPAGYVSNNTDCNDSDATIHSLQTYYRDADGDGYSDQGVDTLVCSFTAPAASAGYWRSIYTLPNGSIGDSTLLPNGTSYAHYTVTNGAIVGAELTPRTAGDHLWDCNDTCTLCIHGGFAETPANIHPGAQELCNNIDDNCNGVIDGDSLHGDGLTYSTFYIDMDGDDFGNPAVDTTACPDSYPYFYTHFQDNNGVNWTKDSTDCNDNPASSGGHIHTPPTVSIAGSSGLVLCSGTVTTLHPYVQYTPGLYPFDIDDSLVYNQFSADSSTYYGYTYITYSWSTSGTTEDISVSSAGTYSVTVNQFGCTGSASVNVTVNPVPTANAGIDQSVCEGDSISLGGSPTGSGGTSPYSYSWSGYFGGPLDLSSYTAANPRAKPLPGGSAPPYDYYVDVTDANGCVAEDTMTITIYAPPTVTISSSTNVSCYGASTGAATASASGTLSPYTYSWSPSGAPTSSVSGLSAGTYTVTVTDGHGCTAFATTTITQPPSLIDSIRGTMTIAYGDTSTLTVYTPASPPQYLWLTTGDTTVSITVTPNATTTYSVSVIDTNGCVTTGGATVTVTYSAPFPATAPDLGAAINYALLSGDSIYAVDTVYSNGKVGALGGINSKIAASDSINAHGSGSVTQALSDLQNAISFCNGQLSTPIDSNLSGQTLAAGVYEINGNATLDSTVYLSGSASDIYIFKINGNFNLSTGSKIAIGLVNPNNIYWDVAGKMIAQSKVSLFGVCLVNDSVQLGDSTAGQFVILSNAHIQINSIDPRWFKTSNYSSTGITTYEDDFTSFGRVSLCNWVNATRAITGGASVGDIYQEPITGSTYADGSINGEVEFGSYILNSSGNEGLNLYLVKYNLDGSINWTAQSHSTLGSGVNAIGLKEYFTAPNNLLVACGQFSGTVSFGRDTVTSSHGGNDLNSFIAEYNADSGSFVNLKVDGTNNFSYFQDVYIDNSNGSTKGNIYVCGQYLNEQDSTINFSGHNFPCPAPSPKTYFNSVNGFVVCYDSSFNYKWGQYLLSNDSLQYINPLGVTANSTHVLISGDFYGRMSINDSSSTKYTITVHDSTDPSLENADGFIIEYDIKNTHSPLDYLITYLDTGYSSFPDLATDNNGDIYATAQLEPKDPDDHVYFKGPSVSPSPFRLNSSFIFDYGIVMKLKTGDTMSVNWIHEPFDSVSANLASNQPRGIAVNDSYVFTTGVFFGTAKAGADTVSAGGNLIFIATMDKSGNPVNAVLQGGNYQSEGRVISATDCRYAASGYIYTNPSTFYLTPTDSVSINLGPGDDEVFMLSKNIDTIQAPVVTLSDTGLSATCAFTPVTITAHATGNIPPYTYLWSTGGMDSSIVVNDWGTYTVHVKGNDPNGCICTVAVDSISLVSPGECCTTSNKADSADYRNIATAYTLDSSFAGTTFDVNANITVSGTVTLTNCTFTFAALRKITIPVGDTLVLVNTYLHACDTMWDGIYVDSVGAALYMYDGTQAHDAENAVVSVNGGMFYVYDCSFIDNYKGIVARKYTGSHTGTVRASTFTSTGTLHAPHNVNSYGAPTIGSCGIEIDTVTQITLGDYSFPDFPPNEFRTLWVGIKITQSNVEVYRSNFSNINGGCFTESVYNPCLAKCAILNESGGCPPEGIAIYDVNPDLLPSGIYDSLTVGNNATPGVGSCTFDSCTVGILAQYDVYGKVLGNSFNYCNYGAYFTSGRGAYLTISGNSFSDFLIGAKVVDWLPNENYLTITNNDFDKGVNYPTVRYGSKAIYVYDYIPNIMLANITNNYINNVDYGIHLRNLQARFENDSTYLNVDSNMVEFRTSNANVLAGIGGSSTQYGILSENCASMSISKNIIRRYNDTANVYILNNLRGIGLKNSTNCRVIENRIGGYLSGYSMGTGLGLGTGIFVQNNCNGSALMCNKMYDNYTSVNLNSAVLPAQGMPTQSWDNYFEQPSYLGPDKIAGTDAKFNWYYYAPLGNLYEPIPFFGNLIRPDTSSSPSSCSPPARLADSLARDAMFGAIVSDSALYSSYPGNNKYYDDEFFYNYMKADTSLLYLGTSLDTAYQLLYDSLKGTNIGAFSNIQQEIDSNNITTGFEEAFSLSPTDTIESNKQTCLEIYYLTFIYVPSGGSPPPPGGASSGPVQVFDDVQTATLTAIANETALEGGEGVYYARAMLGLDIEDGTGGEARMANNKKTTSNSGNIEPIGKFYPNPAKNVLNFDYSIEQGKQGIISFTDLLGRSVLQTQFLGNKNHLEINVSELRSGIYFINVQLNDSVMQRVKQIIVK